MPGPLLPVGPLPGPDPATPEEVLELPPVLDVLPALLPVLLPALLPPPDVLVPPCGRDPTVSSPEQANRRDVQTRKIYVRTLILHFGT